MVVEDIKSFYEANDVIAVFEDRAAQCTGHARLVRRLEGSDVKIFSFKNEENPGTIVDGWGEGDEGHDFAIYKDRYIIDTWMFSMDVKGDRIGRSVFDLKDKNDAEIIRCCYGDASKWTRNQVMEKYADSETLPVYLYDRRFVSSCLSEFEGTEHFDEFEELGKFKI